MSREQRLSFSPPPKDNADYTLMTGNALQAAAAGGHTEIINLLLENKPAALVNTPGGHYGSAIMAATCSGNGDTVWALLEEHANPNMWSRRHGRPLRKAASLGQPYKEIVSLLLDVGAEADLSPKGDAVDILHHAALHNMVDLAKYCLDHGCKIDMVTKQATWYHRRFGDFPPEFTPVGLACAEGHVEMVDFLLRCGAPFEEDREFSAPLWVAAYQGHAGVVDLLLDRFSAKHNEEEKRRYIEQPPHPKNGHPIVFAAVSSCKPAVVSTLLDHGAKYQANWFEASPLLATATYKCPDVTRVLLDYHKQGKINVQINKQARNGRTALSEACANNQPEIVEQLLDAGADYTIPTNVNNTCLHLACHRDNPALVTSLLSKISQDPHQARFHNFLNTRHESGQTALIPCAQAGKIQEVNIILKYGADYTIAGHAGNTPLHWACMNGHDNVVEAILNKAGEDCNDNPERFNAFLNRRNKTEGCSPLFWTCANNHPTTLKLLMSPKFSADYSTTNNSDNTTLHCACHNRFFEIFQTLLEAASNDPNQQRYREWLNKRNSAGQTPAIAATEMARPRMLDILLNVHGADYTLSDNQGFTALHYGAHRNRGECIRHLLECASRDRVSNPQKYMQWINQQSTSNRASALRDGAKQGFPDLVKILLDYGAEWDCVDAAGRTALHYAVERGASEMFAALVDAAKKSKGDEGGGVGSESGEGNEDWEQRVRKWLEQRDKGGRGFWVMGRGLGESSRGKAAELGVDGEWLSWRP